MAKRISLADELAARFSAAESVVVCAHLRPDGDAAGSVLALALMLARQGLRPGARICAAIDRDELGAMSFLCDDWPSDECPLLPPAKAARRRFDLLVCLDCASIDRLPAELRPLVGKVSTVVIDHHVTNTRYGELNWVSDTSSTGELVAALAARARWSMDRRIAEALWVAIVTDSGRFAYDSTRPATLMRAAALLRHGVRTAWLNDMIYAQAAPKAVELRRRAFNSLEVWPGGKVASVVLTARDFSETGCIKSDAEDVVDIARMPRGNLVALFFYETPGVPGVTRLSIRTRPPFDATWLALRHGGGGHTRAAGCDVAAPLAAAREIVAREVADWIDGAESH